MDKAPGMTAPRFLLATITMTLLIACSEPEQAVSSTEPASTGPTYNTSLNMLDFMNLVLEPVADGLWDSAGWINDIETGYRELYPTNDEEWEVARQHAAQIIEAGNALALPGRAADTDAWLTYANALSSAGVLAMNAAASQNQEDYFQAGAQLYSVCTACHQSYNPDISRFVSN